MGSRKIFQAIGMVLWLSLLSTVFGAPEIHSPTDNGWFDLVFQIEKYEVKADGTQSLECIGQHNKEKVGFRLLLSPKWKGGSLHERVPIITYLGEVTLESIGKPTDVFVKILDELYATKRAPKAAKSSVKFSAVSVDGEPTQLAKGNLRMKLFFDSDKKGDNAEAYLEIELRKKLIRLSEKDEVYRLPLVKALGK